MSPRPDGKLVRSAHATCARVGAVFMGVALEGVVFVGAVLVGAVLVGGVALPWGSVASAQLSRPVQCADCIAGWFYFDHDASGAVQDWACMDSTYDGHRGSDFSLSGGNGAIDSGYAVVAAAEGTVETATDGFYDRCTACGGANCGTDFGFGFGNHVVVRHGDQRVVYAHMRMGSVRVAPGDTVFCGQVLGEIGSSGCSTGAHLHFEVRPQGAASRDAYDPFLGMCSPSSRSSWNEQGAFRALPGAVCPAVCPAGIGASWSCEGSERVRCVDGDVTRETCALGCDASGAEATCVEPVPCPDGFGPLWRCDGAERVRCVGGVVTRETCVRCDGSTEQAVCRDDDDQDGDGVGAALDCNDLDPQIFPGALEVCGDGVDQDCDDLDPPCLDGGVVDGSGRVDRVLTGGCGCHVGASPTRTSLWVGVFLFGFVCWKRKNRKSASSRRRE